MQTPVSIGRVVRWGLIAAVLASATVTAQAPLREIDQQVIVDDEGLVEYGGCPADSCVPNFPADGIDLLSLDVREAFLADQRPALCFRLSYDIANPDVPSRTVFVSYAGAKVNEFTMAGLDAPAASVAESDRVLGPTSYGDGMTVEAWFAYDTLGIQPGATLSEIRLQSRTGTQPDDDMPGPWYSNGVAVPHVPHSADAAEAVEEHPPGNYVVKGPSPLLFDVKSTPDDAAFPHAWSISFTNPLTSLGQTVNATVNGNVSVNLDPASVVLGPGQTATINVTGLVPPETGTVRLILVSDLGAQAVVDLGFASPPAKESPATPGIVLIATLLAFGLVKRRGS
jgi:hypothetical protein